MDYSGFVCEIGPDSFKVYDFVHQLVEIDNKDVSGSQQIALGIWLENGDPSTEAFKIDVIDDVVTLKTTALRPNVAALPKAHLREKYRDVVWSPWLQNLHDPKNLFYLCRAEDPVMATVKYAPKDEFLFEVISIEPADDIELTPHNFTDAPWHVETRMDYVRMPTFDENLPRLPENQFRKMDRTVEHLGICVKLFFDNPLRGRNNREGQPEEVHYVYSYELGLVRANPEMNQMELGKWYTFALNDSRKNSSRRAMETTHFASLTCKRAQQEPRAPLVSRVVDGNVQIDTEFIFDHDMLESRENREVEDPLQRLGGLSKVAYFVDPQLGKVEIYPKVSQSIIQVVERRTPDEVELRKDDALVVLVRVQLLRRWLTNFTTNPLSAVFEVAELVDIRYFSDAMSIMAAMPGDV